MKKDIKEYGISKIDQYAIWSVNIFFLLSSTKFFQFWKEDIEFFNQDVSSGSVCVIIAGIVSFFINLVSFKEKKENLAAIVTHSWPFFIILLFFGLSCLWSEEPGITFRRSIKFFLFTLCILNISLKTDTFIYFVKTLTAIVLISSFILLFTPFGWMDNKDGVLLAKGILGHKSGFADFCAVSFLFLLWSYHERKDIFILTLMPLSIMLLLLTQGKNPLIILLISLSQLLFFSIQFNKKMAILNVIVIIALVCVSIQQYYQISLDNLLALIGKDSTFTGRTDIWLALINISLKTNPIIGAGFDSFFIGDKSAWLLKFLNWDAPDAHCGYLKVFTEGGFIGLILFLFFIGHLYLSLLTLRSKKNGSILIAIITYGILYNFVSNSFLSIRISFILFIWLSLYTRVLKETP